jgi:hypothetical protein
LLFAVRLLRLEKSLSRSLGAPPLMRVIWLVLVFLMWELIDRKRSYWVI